LISGYEEDMSVTATSFAASSASTASSGQTSKISSDFNTFLRMLTVQMQNQDPLNPIDSADYAVQLATFSGVEQQVRTNQLLADMQARFQQMGMAEMASWIGQEARSNAPVFYDGDPVTLSPNPAQGATGAVVVVRDAQGNLVSRENIPASVEPYRWLGADAAGNPLPRGIYSLTLESRQGENVIDSRPIEHYARVIEARGGAGGTKLVLEGGVEVSASAVTALRLPQG
jgi:flagellar basal-body rod modification protein FlgD